MKKSQIDLGLAISHALTKEGQRRSCAEIAAFCGCSLQYIQAVEFRALKKLRRRLQVSRDDLAAFR